MITILYFREISKSNIFPSANIQILLLPHSLKHYFIHVSRRKKHFNHKTNFTKPLVTSQSICMPHPSPDIIKSVLYPIRICYLPKNSIKVKSPSPCRMDEWSLNIGPESSVQDRRRTTKYSHLNTWMHASVLIERACFLSSYRMVFSYVYIFLV